MAKKLRRPSNAIRRALGLPEDPLLKLLEEAPKEVNLGDALRCALGIKPSALDQMLKRTPATE